MASPFYLFRKYQRAFIAIAAVVAMFIFVVADPLMSWLQSGSGPQRSGKTVVATWDGGDITLSELDRRTQRRFQIHQFLGIMVEQARQKIEGEGGTVTPPNLPNFVLRTQNPQAIQQGCVYTKVFADLAKKSGISVSDKFINHYLKEWGLGKTGNEEMKQLLSQVGLSDKSLFAGLRELLMTHFYTSSLTFASAGSMPEERWADWKRINERIVLEAAVLPAEKFLSEVPKPEETVLKQFYEQHKDRLDGMFDQEMGSVLPSPDPGFREPRKVKIQYLSGIVDDWTEKMLDSVTDEEIADFYERNKRTMFVKTSTSSATTSIEGLFDDEPADEAPADEAPADEASEAEATEDEAGSEEPMAEEAAAEGPATETVAEPKDESAEPSDTATEEPDGGAPAEENAAEEDSAAPAEVEEVVEEAAEEAADAPSEQDSGSATPKSPFRLAAFQTESEESEAEESAEDVTEDASDEAAPADDDSETTEDEEEVEYEPLENVVDQIRRSLAVDKAVVELKKVTDRTFGKLQAAYNPYGFEVVSAETEERDVPAPPAELADYKAIATDTGLASEETVLLSQRKLSETIVGRAFDSQTRTKFVHQAMFGDLELYEPLRATDLAGNSFIVCKTEDVATRVPEFDEVKDAVLEAWNDAEAAKLALAKAEELAKAAQESGDTVAVAAGADNYEVVTTDAFSWMTFGTTQAEMQRGPRLNEAPPLTSVDDAFMEKAFALEPNEKIAVLNHDHTAAYVIQLSRRELTKDELQKQFLSDAVNGWFGGQMMEFVRRQVSQRQFEAKLTDQINLNIEPLMEIISSNPSSN